MEERFKYQIEQWQVKWQHLQDIIKDQIEAKDYAGAYRSQIKAGVLKRCIEDAYNVLKPD